MTGSISKLNRKVLIVIGSLTGGGAERVVLGLSSYLVRRGHSVCVVTMHGEERDFFRLDPGVRRIGLGLAYGNKGPRKIHATIKRIRALRRVIRAEQAGAVIGMMTTASVLSIMACIGLEARAIACERNYPGRKAIDRSWGIMRRLTYPFAASHVAQTRECADWLTKNARARHVRTIPNAAAWPITDVKPRVEPASLVDTERRLVLAVGSKSHQKGFDLLLRAFASAAGGREEWGVAIVGLGGPSDPSFEQRETLKMQAENLGIGARTYFPGRVGNMSEWYRRADIFVLSSRYEGFPNALLEAMASGCASVSFNCDTGPRDIIDHNVNGVLVPPEDPEMLASAIQTLMDDELIREKLAANAVYVREAFSEERIFEQWNDAIREVMT